jgi:hypothetical protein
MRKLLSYGGIRNYILPLFIVVSLLEALNLFTIGNESEENEHQEGAIPGALHAMDLWGDMRAYPFGEIKAGGFSKSFDLGNKMSIEARTRVSGRTESTNTTPWTDLAPKNFAGRVLSMAFNPTDSNTIWVGSAAGGLWKTTNGGHGAANGINWTYVPTGFPVLGISAIAIPQTNPNVLYIGTGEVYNTTALNSGVTGAGHVRTFRGSYGIGILKSTNGGLSWTKSLDFSYSNLKGVSDILIDSANNSIVYAATTDGLYRSIDAGTSWQLMPGVPGLATSLAYKPGSPSVLYIGCGNFRSTGAGIYRSTNANITSGTPTFTKLTTGLPTTISGKIQLAVTPASPSTVYASIGNDPARTTDPEGLYRSTNDGSSWTGLRTGTNSIISNQGWYAHDVAVSRTNATRVYWGELNLHRSTNSGSTFTVSSNWAGWNVNNTTIGTLSEGSTSYVHADIHRIIMSPFPNSNTIYICTDGGIFRTRDFGTTYQSLNGGLQTAQIYANAAISRQDPNFMLMGLQDNEGLIYMGQPGCKRVPNLGDGFHAAIKPTNDNICYIESYDLRVIKSINKAGSFSALTGPFSPTCFNSPFIIPLNSPTTIYAGTALFKKSTNEGSTFTNMNGGVSISGTPILYIEAAPSNASTVYISTTPSNTSLAVPIRSGLFKTINGGTSFTNITGTLPNRYYTDIAVDPVDPNRLVVTLSGFGVSHVFLSTNGGTSWCDIGGGLVDLPTNTVAFDPLDRSRIYIGNDQGVYYASGLPLSGATPASLSLTWISYNEGLGDGVMVSDIVVTTTNKLRLATYGRGLWERDLAPATTVVRSNQTITSTKKLQAYPNPTSGFINLQLPDIIQNGPAQVKLYSQSGQLVFTQKFEVWQSGRQLSVNIQHLPKGTYTLVCETGKEIHDVRILKQ